MDKDTLLFLLRGGHLSVSERIARNLWPHPSLKFSDVVDCLATEIEAEIWFPYEWKPVTGEPVREGGVIEKQSSAKYVYHSYRHQANTPEILAEQSEKVFKSPEEAARYYLKWDVNLPGDLDGWKVTE